MNAMASPIVSFGCTALLGTNKKGTIQPDADGYYPVVLGALNTFNSAGAYYPLGPAQPLFENSSAFMRRVTGGNLRGECGHPRKQVGENDRDYAIRLNDIYEPNVSHHIRKVWLEPGYKDENGRPIVLIMGEVRPSGPRGAALKEALDNRHEDVCFSIRAFTFDQPVGGIWQKYLRQIVTWDWVNEPGISAAHKWRAPTLESYIDSEFTLSRETLMVMASEERVRGIGLESGNGVTIQSLVDAMGWNKPAKIARPASANW
jgi:hypothetical protein